MYRLHLHSGGAVSSAELQHALGQLERGQLTHETRMRHLAALEALEARGMRYANQDFDVLSAALNFLDAVLPDHTLREPAKAMRPLHERLADHAHAYRKHKTPDGYTWWIEPETHVASILGSGGGQLYRVAHRTYDAAEKAVLSMLAALRDDTF